MTYRIYLLSIVCFVFSGCATAYYSTSADPRVVFNKQEPLTIYTDKNPSVSDKKFAILLGELMAKEGFQISGFNTSRQNTPCGITFSIDTSSSTYTGSYHHTTYHTQTTYIPGSYSGHGFNPGRTIRTQVPTTHTYYYTGVIVSKDIGVSIFCRDKAGERSQIWFGFMSANINNL